MRRKMLIELFVYVIITIIGIFMLIWGKPPTPPPIKMPKMENFNQQQILTQQGQGSDLIIIP